MAPLTPPRRAGLPLQGAGAFSLFLVYWQEDLEGSTSHTCMCVHLRRAEMRSYLSKEAGGSGDHHQMAVGRLWSANSEFTLSSRRAACLWGCRLRRLLAAGSTCLVCTPWFQPPWKLGPGLVGSLQHHPTACLLPGQARPPGPPQLCSVQSSLTPLPTTLDLQDPPVFLWGPPEMDRQAGQESLPSALRTHSPPTTAPSASLPWERKRQPLLSEACNFLGTWFADSFLCFLSLCRKEISNLTQKVEVGQTSRHPREAWETRKK